MIPTLQTSTSERRSHSYTAHQRKSEEPRSELSGAKSHGHMYEPSSDVTFLLSPSAHRLESCCILHLY
ncbi:hypothetical protein DH86_00000154, partial [Scytalidium sp. 3C]